MLDTKAIASALAPIVKDHVERATAPLLERIAELEARAPEKGEAGSDGRDGVDGKDADMDALKAHCEALIAALPQPENGKDGRDGVDGAAGERGADGAAGRDGKDGADGIGLAGAIIDRAGELIVTLTNGETRSLGPVVGRDGKDGLAGERGERGFSLDSFDTEMLEDGRTIRLKFVAGDTTEIHELQFPLTIYRGVFREGETYQSGDEVTWAGSAWHCASETTEKPGEGSKGWLLKVKRGRDGKDFAGPQAKAPGKVRV